jgi:hypothetical protein
MAVEAFSFSASEVIGTKRDKHAIWGYDRYAAAHEPLQVEVVCILEGHGRYGEAPGADLLEKNIQVKRAFDPRRVRTVPSAAGNLFCQWEATG